MPLEPSLETLRPVSSPASGTESFLVQGAWAVANVCQWLFLVGWSVFWISLALVLTALTWNRHLPLLMARRFWAPGILWGAGCRVHPEPLPELDWTKPYIFVMNHQSMLDIPCAFAFLPVDLRFVAKHSLRNVPFLGWYMRMTGMIFVDRSNRRRAVRSLRAAGERIRAGASILVYPEGTRSKDDRIHPFKKGPFVLAVEAQVPMVPVAIHGTGEALRSGKLKLRPRDVHFKVGLPIPTAGRNAAQRDSLIHEVRDALSKLHQDLGGPGAAGHDIAAVGVEGAGN